MGCASSKNAVPSTPPIDSSEFSRSSREILAGSLWNRVNVDRSESGESGKLSSNGTNSQSFRLGNLYRYIEGEQCAAGWPSWLSSVAKEAIYGLVPLKAESFEKLEKVGQGTYSTVFKARDLDTGNIVAIKKVRFDNCDLESVKFMAREILILRRLNHPNIVKLEGIITSRLSCSLYLVFEYMEHDLAGLSSAPDIKFSESQVKCYMHQLLSGLEHCHSHGIIHRDIKCANLLVNNEGILKMADFGLANFSKPSRNQPLTSRVVTLWYRPPELLMGATNYDAAVDLWSVGCVFAELFLGKPILQGRTEVEQIHKIFKLCGSPSEEYWRKYKLPHSTVFKPQQPYESCLSQSFNYLPESTLRLLETFLALEPYKRGTAGIALSSEYFKSKPYACEPSNLPKYSPHKEIDVRNYQNSHRRSAAGKVRGSEFSRRPSRTHRRVQSIGQQKLVHPETLWIKNISVDENGTDQNSSGEIGQSRLLVDLQPMPTINLPNEDHHSKNMLKENYPFSGPVFSYSASGPAWASKRKDDHSSNRFSISCSRDRASGAFDSCILHPKNTLELKIPENEEFEGHEDSKGKKTCGMEKEDILKKLMEFDCHDSINGTDVYNRRNETKGRYMRDTISFKHHRVKSDYQDLSERVDFSGSFLNQSNKVDELLEKHERHMRQAVRKSWNQREHKHDLPSLYCLEKDNWTQLKLRRTQLASQPRNNTAFRLVKRILEIGLRGSQSEKRNRSIQDAPMIEVKLTSPDYSTKVQTKMSNKIF